MIRLIAIYEHPRDFPHSFVARLWVAGAPGIYVSGEPCAVAPSLEDARKAVPTGFSRYGRDPQDDPVIVEVWIETRKNQ